MIFRLLIAAAVLYGIYRFVKIVRSKPPAQRRPYYITLLISIAAAGLVLLSITGRVHWIAGLIGAAMPFVRQFVLQRVYRHLNGGQQQGGQQQTGKQQAPPARGGMSKVEALSILGLKAGASEDDIVRAHRQLMQKLHPDRGGNDYLASQLNEAKSVLLG